MSAFLNVAEMRRWRRR